MALALVLALLLVACGIAGPAGAVLPPTCPGGRPRGPDAGGLGGGAKGGRPRSGSRRSTLPKGCSGKSAADPRSHPRYNRFGGGGGGWVMPDPAERRHASRPSLRGDLHDPGAGHDRHTKVAASYAAAAGSLLRPPSGEPLRV